jgi:hypothetical protein
MVQRRVPDGRPVTVVALGLAALLLVAGCATSTPQISDEERCLRFGGLWMATWCRYDGGGGSM